MRSWTLCPFNQRSEISTERLPEWWAEAVWGAYPETNENSKIKNVLCVPDYSSNLLSVSRCTEWGHSFIFEKGNSCLKLQKGTRVKLTQENYMFYLPCGVLEFKISSPAWNWTVQGSGTDNWVIWIKRMWSRMHQRQLGNPMMYAMCVHWPGPQRLQYQEWQRPKQNRSWRGWSQTWWDLSE